jgi:hypothetical protein
VSIRTNRLAAGEWLLGVASVLLLVDLFAVVWFEYRPQFHATAAMLGQRVSANGWDSFTVIGPLALVVCAGGVAVWVLTATRLSPALPVVITTLLAPLSFVLAVLVAIRVLADRPSVHLAQAGGANVIEARAGAYIGLALSVSVFVGIYMAMRREGVAGDDSPSTIETLSIEQSRTSARA